MELDLRQLLQIARRRAWIVVLIVLVAAAAAYFSSSRQTPMYSADATMFVNPGRGAESNDLSALQASRSLAETYSLRIETGPVLERVIEELNLAVDVDGLDDMMSTNVVGESQLVRVTVEHTDPELASDIANTTVAEFRDYIDEQVAEQAERHSSEFEAEIDQLETSLAELDAQIAELNAQDSDDPEVQQELESLTQERSRIEGWIDELNTTVRTISTETITGSTQIEMADPARPPESPFEPRVLFSTALGAFVGLLIAVGLVALLEYFDNTVKPETDVQSLAGAPMLASVAMLPKLKSGAEQVFTIAKPNTNASEAMRLLRTNLDFAAATDPISTLTVTSAGPQEGKSTVTSNLGVVMAQAGFRTVIVDADLRRPSQHRIFGVGNSTGVTSLLTDSETSWEDVAVKVALPGLYLLPSGPLPPNPSDLLGSNRFHELLDRLKADLDLVIVDTAPILAVSDPLSVASYTDGVILVAASNTTRVDGLRHAAEAVHHGGIRLVGVVMNRVRRQQGGSYYGEYYGTEQETATRSQSPRMGT